MEHKQLLTMKDLQEYVSKQTLDVDTIYQHYEAGTIDALYEQTLTDLVNALMMIPINRMNNGLVPTEENEVVSDTVASIANLIATAYNRSPVEVQAAVLQAVQQFPASDVREATMLRYGNRLN